MSGRARTDAIRILAGNDLLDLPTPRGLDQDVLLRVRVEPLRRGWPESEFTSVRLSALEEPYEGRIGSHIFVRSLAPWETLPEDGAERYDVRAVTQRVFPMVAYEDTAKAIDWLTEAFGFTERGQRYEMEDGTIGHAEVEIGGEVVMLAPQQRVPEPQDSTVGAATRQRAGSTTPG